MEEQRRRTTHHRGRRKKKKKASLISNLILIIAIAVFCVSGFQLFKILRGYQEGRSEYDKVREIAVTNEKKEDEFAVDFEELKKINPDTIGWIRFYPEPKEISYPIVQGKDNDKYLHKTFSANENTLGAIFVNAYNTPSFADKNTIIYGHRMKDGSMFRHLEDYKDESFWKENQYFYIYTPDGRKLTYHICSVGQIEDTSESYKTDFTTVEEFEAFLKVAMESAYDTGVEVNGEDKIVTLSTCTSASDNHRFVVRGVLDKEEKVK